LLPNIRRLAETPRRPIIYLVPSNPKSLKYRKARECEAALCVPAQGLRPA
jgi:hypothetical protein